MSLTKISGFVALTSYLGLGGAATVLRSNPRTLAIIAATGFVFDLIQANSRAEGLPPRRRPDYRDDDYLEEDDIEMPPHRPEYRVDHHHFRAGGAGAGAGHDSDFEEPLDLPAGRRRLAGRAGGAAAARAAPYAEEAGEPGILAKLANKVSRLFHSVCGGVSWVSQKFHTRNTFAYHYINTFYLLTRNFYNGVLPREYR